MPTLCGQDRLQRETHLAQFILSDTSTLSSTLLVVHRGWCRLQPLCKDVVFLQLVCTLVLSLYLGKHAGDINGPNFMGKFWGAGRTQVKLLFSLPVDHHLVQLGVLRPFCALYTLVFTLGGVDDGVIKWHCLSLLTSVGNFDDFYNLEFVSSYIDFVFTTCRGEEVDGEFARWFLLHGCPGWHSSHALPHAVTVETLAPKQAVVLTSPAGCRRSWCTYEQRTSSFSCVSPLSPVPSSLAFVKNIIYSTEERCSRFATALLHLLQGSFVDDMQTAVEVACVSVLFNTKDPYGHLVLARTRSSPPCSQPEPMFSCVPRYVPLQGVERRKFSRHGKSEGHSPREQPTHYQGTRVQRGGKFFYGGILDTSLQRVRALQVAGHETATGQIALAFLTQRSEYAECALGATPFWLCRDRFFAKGLVTEGRSCVGCSWVALPSICLSVRPARNCSMRQN